MKIVLKPINNKLPTTGQKQFPGKKEVNYEKLEEAISINDKYKVLRLLFWINIKFQSLAKKYLSHLLSNFHSEFQNSYFVSALAAFNISGISTWAILAFQSVVFVIMS